jgi:hypothetical protein
VNTVPRRRNAIPQGRPITKDDLEAKFSELKGGVDSEVANVRNVVIAAGIAVISAAVLVSFVLGRRKGKRLATIVEIRRV